MRSKGWKGSAAAACRALGGVGRREQMIRAGVDDQMLRRAVRAGELERVRPGTYANSDLPAPIRSALRHGGVLACVSVLRTRGLWVLPLDEVVHVSLPPNGHARSHPGCSCVQHWNSFECSPTQVSLVDALLQVRGCQGEDAFFAALESALHEGVLSRNDRAVLRGRITESAQWLVDFARRDADSGLESLLRLRLHRLGISLRTQVAIPGVGRVDFVLGDRLILEVDGKPNHVPASKRHRDLVRDAVAAAHGFDTLRFDYALVIHDWPLVEAAILAKLDRGLHLAGSDARGVTGRRGIRSTR
ncbi:MAG TPA: type IV toxin-antitoxin system AbiEi family antitoxin domain-containing protein [Agromyces mariniharenae]|nr:type IV toxin-antitoxin system AbiEi family antitoxin domain-containing protein [Agromyces mariniharenae]